MPKRNLADQVYCDQEFVCIEVGMLAAVSFVSAALLAGFALSEDDGQPEDSVDPVPLLPLESDLVMEDQIPLSEPIDPNGTLPRGRCHRYPCHLEERLASAFGASRRFNRAVVLQLFLSLVSFGLSPKRRLYSTENRPKWPNPQRSEMSPMVSEAGAVARA